MMLIICDKSPDKAVEWLIKNTNKKFCWKQLLELCQLLAGCGITDKMKSIRQGKAIQKWIIKYKWWTLRYFNALFDWAKMNVQLSVDTMAKLNKIHTDLCTSTCWIDIPDTAIWRYSKDYKNDYENNSELPINECCAQYRKYLDWKFERVYK